MQKALSLNNNYFLIFIFYCANLVSQNDTLFTFKKEKISCKITEITDDLVKYSIEGQKEKIKLAEVEKIVFKNGVTEKFAQKPEKFDLKSAKTRDLIQANANVWGIKLLKCAFTKVSLSTTYINWDQTYTEMGNDSIINISLKTFYALPGIEDREEIYWRVKTDILLWNKTFSFVRATDHMTSDLTFLNCIHKLNRFYKEN